MGDAMGPGSDADNLLIERWVAWLQRISKEVLQLHHNRQLFQELRDAVVAVSAPDAPDTWLNHYAYVYAHSQVIGIRRVTRGDNTSISLTRLIGDIKKQAVVLTRERHLAHYDDALGGLRSVAERQFEEMWGDSGGHVAPDKVHGRLSSMMQDLKAVLSWADTVAAHITETPADLSVTFADVHAAVDRVGDAFNELSVLLTASTWMLTPRVQGDWKAPFRRPLFEPRG